MKAYLSSRKWDSNEASIQRCSDCSYEQLDKVDVQTLFFFGSAYTDDRGDVCIQFGREKRKCILAGIINSTFFTNPTYVLFSPAFFQDNSLLLDYPAFIFHSLFIATKQYQIKPPISSSYVLSVLRDKGMLLSHCQILIIFTYS